MNGLQFAALGKSVQDRPYFVRDPFGNLLRDLIHRERVRALAHHSADLML